MEKIERRGKIKTVSAFLFFIFLITACSSSIDSLYDSAVKDLQNKRYDSAEQKFKKILSYQVLSHEKLANLYKTIGVNYVNSRMFDMAIEKLNEAAGYRPNDWEVYFYLGIAYSNKARLDSYQLKPAEENYLKALKLNEGASDVYYALAMLYYAGYENSQKASDVFKELLNKDPNYIRAYKSLAKIYYEKGDLASAVDYYRQAASILPAGAEKSSFYLMMAKVYIEWKNYDMARNSLNEAIKHYGRNEEAKRLLNSIS